jgi:hypothetical protein
VPFGNDDDHVKENVSLFLVDGSTDLWERDVPRSVELIRSSAARCLLTPAALINVHGSHSNLESVRVIIESGIHIITSVSL